jgi:FPC/CPF motif-containing protein YcgG
MENSNTVEPLNPFSEFADFSSYSKWQNDEIVRVFEPEKKFSPLFYKVHDDFRSHISNVGFPCVGAKAALNGNCYRFGFYAEMNSQASTAGLAFDLWNYVREQSSFGTNYATFVACFGRPSITDEKHWEELLWAQLTGLNEIDSTYYKWDASVSNDPENPNFSFSFAETAFFIVGLHPMSSRISRRFPWATLVFNIREQFQRLRDENQFERMRKTIRARDLKLQGSLNPNLSDFGERSEARQYSGRAVEENWKCPFHKSS